MMTATIPSENELSRPMICHGQMLDVPRDEINPQLPPTYSAAVAEATGHSRLRASLRKQSEIMAKRTNRMKGYK